MKKSLLIVMAIVGASVLFSCKKDYHCSCSFNNNLVYSVDLGNQYKDNAQSTCNGYDTTVKGETWQCVVY
jgi:hypothetical protein